jgi:transposase, IS5 family
VLRLLILKHVRNWSYDVLEREVRANLVYRNFTRVGGGKTTDAKTMGRWGMALGPAVLKQIHGRMVRIAQDNGVTTGRRMRVDTTVVETNIHHPTDSTLLGDGVRVLTRIMKKTGNIAGTAGTKLRDRTRSVKLRLLEIGRVARSKGPVGQDRLTQHYRRLLDATSRVVGQAKRFSEEIARVIRKGKAGKPNEFGKMVKLQEAENQIVIDYEVYARRPNDSDILVAAIDTHRALLGRAPRLVAADAAFYSNRNEAAAKAKGVKRVCIPNRSTKSTERRREQRKRWFRNGQKWRTGCDGRISVVKRRHGLDRCRYKGIVGMQRWVGFGVIADNIINIGRTMEKRAAK